MVLPETCTVVAGLMPPWICKYRACQPFQVVHVLHVFLPPVVLVVHNNVGDVRCEIPMMMPIMIIWILRGRNCVQLQPIAPTFLSHSAVRILAANHLIEPGVDHCLQDMHSGRWTIAATDEGCHQSLLIQYCCLSCHPGLESNIPVNLSESLLDQDLHPFPSFIDVRGRCPKHPASYQVMGWMDG